MMTENLLQCECGAAWFDSEAALEIHRQRWHNRGETMKPQEIVTKLEELRDERKNVLRRLGEIKREMGPLVVEAHELGMPKLQISRTTGLTRQTVYGILLRDQARARTAA